MLLGPPRAGKSEATFRRSVACAVRFQIRPLFRSGGRRRGGRCSSRPDRPGLHQRHRRRIQVFPDRAVDLVLAVLNAGREAERTRPQFEEIAAQREGQDVLRKLGAPASR